MALVAAQAQLDASRVSRRLLDALGKALGADLIASGGLTTAAPGQALFRAEEEAGASFEDELEIHATFGLGPDTGRHQHITGPAPDVS